MQRRASFAPPRRGADLARTLGRRTAPALSCVVLLVMLAATALLVHVARRQDEAATASARHLVETLAREREDRLRRVAVDYAAWDEAYRNLHEALSLEWALERGNLAGSLEGTFGIELAFVVAPDGRVPYAFKDGRHLAAADPRRGLEGGVEALLAAARAATPVGATATRPASGWLLLDGLPALAAATAIIPGVEGAAALPEAPSLLVLVDRLTEAELVRRGDRDLVEGARLLGPRPPLPAALPLAGFDGAPVGQVAWTQRLPGRELQRALLPWLLASLAAALAATVLVLREAQRAARALTASEARFRDASEASSDWVWETDAELRLTFVSDRFAEMTGVLPEEALGRPLTAYLELEGAHDGRRALRDLLLDSRVAAHPRVWQCVCRDRRGAERVCRLSARAVPGAAGATAVGYRGAVSDVTPEAAAQREARRLSLHDPLTGLPNRALLMDRLGRAVREAHRQGRRIAVLCVDLDRFKPVNDTHGHAAGDLVLLEAARRLRACAREGDTVARVGGDEFVVVVAAPAAAGEVAALCDRLTEALAHPFELPTGAVAVGASVGVAWCPDDAADPDRLLSQADMALYEAKRAGRGAWRSFGPALGERLARRRGLERELREAVEAEALELGFRPRFRLGDMRLVAAEALPRLRHPPRGAALPAELGPIAEGCGLDLPVAAWALREACRRAAGAAGLVVSVDVPPAALGRGGFADRLGRILDETGLQPARLELELAEGGLAPEAGGQPLETMRALKAMGVRLTLDGFGAGHASLNQLRRFPLDRVKIAGPALTGLEEDAAVRAFLRSVLGFGRALGLAVTAEGVETAGQLRVLRAEGCDEAQGPHLGRVASWVQIERRLPPPPAARPAVTA